MDRRIVVSLEKDYFNCIICLERLKDPKMLPCAHTFCSKCLENHSKDDSLTCPTCRKETVLSPKGVNGLPSSFLIKNLMEKVDMPEDSGSSGSSCNFCRVASDVHFCLDCKLNVCTRCKIFHDKIPGTTEHTTVMVERLSDEKYMKRIRASHVPKCDKHKGEKLVFFCSSCRKLTCRDCKMLDHLYHRVVTADEGHSSLRKRLKSLVNIAIQDSKSTRETTGDITSLMGRVEVHVDGVKKEVEHEYTVAVKRCEDDKAKLLDEITTIAQENVKPLQEVSTIAQGWASEMEVVVERTLEMLNEDIKWNVLQEGNALVDTLLELSRDGRRLAPGDADKQLKSISFKPSLKRSAPGNVLGTVCDGDPSSFEKPQKFAKLDMKSPFANARGSQGHPPLTQNSGSLPFPASTSGAPDRSGPDSTDRPLAGFPSTQPAFGNGAFVFGSSGSLRDQSTTAGPGRTVVFSGATSSRIGSTQPITPLFGGSNETGADSSNDQPNFLGGFRGDRLPFSHSRPPPSSVGGVTEDQPNVFATTSSRPASRPSASRRPPAGHESGPHFRI